MKHLTRRAACRYAVAMVAIGPWFTAGCRRTPQIVPTREAIQFLDGWNTAISVKDLAQIRRLEGELPTRQQAGQIDEAVARLLRRIAEDCRRQNWTEAGEKLRELIQGQRSAHP